MSGSPRIKIHDLNAQDGRIQASVTRLVDALVLVGFRHQGVIRIDQRIVWDEGKDPDKTGFTAVFSENHKDIVNLILARMEVARRRAHRREFPDIKLEETPSVSAFVGEIQ